MSQRRSGCPIHYSDPETVSWSQGEERPLRRYHCGEMRDEVMAEPRSKYSDSGQKQTIDGLLCDCLRRHLGVLGVKWQ
jgi:hypothetical protein